MLHIYADIYKFALIMRSQLSETRNVRSFPTFPNYIIETLNTHTHTYICH